MLVAILPFAFCVVVAAQSSTPPPPDTAIVSLRRGDPFIIQPSVVQRCDWLVIKDARNKTQLFQPYQSHACFPGVSQSSSTLVLSFGSTVPPGLASVTFSCEDVSVMEFFIEASPPRRKNNETVVMPLCASDPAVYPNNSATYLKSQLPSMTGSTVPSQGSSPPSPPALSGSTSGPLASQSAQPRHSQTSDLASALIDNGSELPSKSRFATQASTAAEPGTAPTSNNPMSRTSTEIASGQPAGSEALATSASPSAEAGTAITPSDPISRTSTEIASGQPAGSEALATSANPSAGPSATSLWKEATSTDATSANAGSVTPGRRYDPSTCACNGNYAIRRTAPTPAS